MLFFQRKIVNLKKCKFLKIYIKIEKTITKFGDIEIWKQKFHQQKGFISTKNVDISKIAVSNKFPFGERGFKHFIGYKDVKTIKHLNIFLPKKMHIEKTLMKLSIQKMNY